MRKLLSVILVVLLLAPLVNASAVEVTFLGEDLDAFSIELLQVIQEEVEQAIQRKQNPDASGSDTTLGLTQSNRMTPKRLHEAYKSNSIGADAKYKGAVIEIEGYIDSINQETIFGDRIYINITSTKDSWDFDTVMCFLKASERDKVIDMSKGDRIVITGTGDGKAFTSISMNDCTIIQDAP